MDKKTGDDPFPGITAFQWVKEARMEEFISLSK